MVANGSPYSTRRRPDQTASPGPEHRPLRVEEEAANEQQSGRGAVHLPFAGQTLQLMHGFPGVSRPLGGSFREAPTMRIHGDPATDQRRCWSESQLSSMKPRPSPSPQKPMFSSQLTVINENPS